VGGPAHIPKSRCLDARGRTHGWPLLPDGINFRRTAQKWRKKLFLKRTFYVEINEKKFLVLFLKHVFISKYLQYVHGFVAKNYGKDSLTKTTVHQNVF
jgi:hypothetical protein